MKIEFLTGYDDQVVPGNERDKDVYSRMCGIENGVCVLKLTINENQENQLILELCSIGDQRIELPDNEADPLYEAIENANKFELFEESERLLILRALNNQELNFGNITYKAIKNEYESSLGLEGVWESMDLFIKHFQNPEMVASYLEYLDSI